MPLHTQGRGRESKSARHATYVVNLSLERLEAAAGEDLVSVEPLRALTKEIESLQFWLSKGPFAQTDRIETLCKVLFQSPNYRTCQIPKSPVELTAQY